MSKTKSPPKKKAPAKKAKLKELSTKELRKFTGGRPIPTGHHGRLN